MVFTGVGFKSPPPSWCPFQRPLLVGLRDYLKIALKFLPMVTGQIFYGPFSPPCSYQQKFWYFIPNSNKKIYFISTDFTGYINHFPVKLVSYILPVACRFPWYYWYDFSSESEKPNPNRVTATLIMFVPRFGCSF